MNSRKTVVTLLNQFLVFFVNLLTLKLTMSALSPGDYGLYGYALSLTGLFMAFSELNLSGIFFKRIAEGEDLQKHYSTYITIRLILTGIAAAFYLLYSCIDKAPVSSGHLAVFLTVLTYYFVDAMMLAVMGAYQSRREVRRTQSSNTLMAVANLLFIAVFVAPTGDVRLLALALVFRPLVGLACLVRFTRGELKVFRFSLDRAIVREYIRFILPLLPMSVLGVIYDRIDGTLVTKFHSYQETGYFTAASMFNTALLIPSTAIITLLYSSYSEEVKAGNYSRVQDISRRATKYLSLLVNPVAIFICFHAERFVLLAMSSDYLPTVPIVRIFMFQVILMSVSRTFDAIFMASERLRLVSIMGISLYLLGIALNYILIPEQLFGFRLFNLKAAGPACKALLVYSLYICMTGYLLRKIHRVMIYWRFLLHMVAALAAGFAALTFNLPDNTLSSLTLCAAVYFCLYLLFLTILRELQRKDLEYFSSVICFWRDPAQPRVLE